MLPSGYSSRQSGQYRSSNQAGVFSSASSSMPQQTQQGVALRYSSRSTYVRYTIEQESELGHLLSPPSPPPSLEQVLSVGPSTGPSNSSSQRPTPTPSASTRHQSIYYDLERELFAESSSSTPQPDADSRYQCLYEGFAQALSAAPGSSRQQAATTELTSRTSQGPHSYPGVSYVRTKNRWRVRWRDPTLNNQRVSLGSYATRSEAINALEEYKASRKVYSRMNNNPGAYFISSGKWQGKYTSHGRQVHVGTFPTAEDAARAVQEHRAARGLRPMRGATRMDQSLQTA